MRTMNETIRVLYEDNHLLVVNKPAGLATMGVGPDDPSLWRLACRYLKTKYRKPGNVYLGVVSRLDALVTGVVVFARTSKAAARLTEQFREADVHKLYWAIVERPPEPAQGACLDWLVKDEAQRRIVVANASTPDAREARLRYSTLARLPRAVGQTPGATLVEVELETGRKHQIRVQLASRGWPVVGDGKYGARAPFPQGIGLHARQLRLLHPVRREPLELIAPVPTSWPVRDDWRPSGEGAKF